MTADDAGLAALSRHYLRHYPGEAAAELAGWAWRESVALLTAEPPAETVPTWEALPPDVAEQILARLPPETAYGLLSRMDPTRGATLLARLDEAERERHLATLPTGTARELQRLMEYPPESAGRLMDPRVAVVRPGITARDALARLREAGGRAVQIELFVVDADGHLVGSVPVHELAVADPDASIDVLIRTSDIAVAAMASREEVVDALERHRRTTLPVVDFHGRLTGVIRHPALVSAVQEETTADLQTMVGASRDEHALSSAMFAVRRRLPWLHINLITAFLAASVVGVFESTIAQFTALAVLLPVVAGQSGNAGAQALAVTIRGLALHEISARDGLRVALKETRAGLVNGLAIAVTCGLGVLVWSQSAGLATVIGTSMVIAMVAAGLSGALIPVTLTRLGQDPAQASSIFLTTVTDVVGFFSFLGIATLLAGFL